MSIFQVQQKLLDLWSTSRVDQAYQGTFLAKLDQLGENKAKEMMQREIYNTYNGQTEYEYISKLNKERIAYLNKFSSKYSKHDGSLNYEKIKKMCHDFDCLRKFNLMLIEACLNFGRKEAETSDGQARKTNGEEFYREFCQNYSPLFSQINKDNEIVKRSAIKEYIEFSPNFDPFFMAQYEIIKGYLIEVHPEVAKVYKFGVTFAYRCMKAKK